MKQVIQVQQGTPEWHQLRANYFTASEAAAMLGLSKYMSRSELLKQKATGITPEVTPAKQKLFDAGHQVEEMARPIAEVHIGEELFPATVTNEVEGLPLLASMDGVTMLYDKGFEHKMWNAEFAEMVNNGMVPDTHWPQLEQQILVSGVEAILFVVSDGTEENRAQLWYESVPARRAQVIQGWHQFKANLDNYVPEVKAEVVEADPIRDLPAISYKMDGLRLTSNLNDYKVAANELVEKSKQVIETDQDFANAEAMVKVFDKAEKEIAALCDRVLGEVADIDAFTKDLRYISEQIRQARLATDKQVKSRKEEIRINIMTKAKADLNKAINDAELRIKCRLPNLVCDVLQSMKGKKTVESLKDAAATEVAKGKVEITNYLNTALSNMAIIRELAPDHKHLFNDWPSIAFKATDDFTALVKTRLTEEQARVDAERARIRAEEEAKATAAAEPKLKSEADAQAKADQQAAALKAAEGAYEMNPDNHRKRIFADDISNQLTKVNQTVSAPGEQANESFMQMPTTQKVNKQPVILGTAIAAWAKSNNLSNQSANELYSILADYGINLTLRVAA